ncbi:hypothetical protein AMAG_14124 [Allomyces macrogynus ATCC 38327]|uniref:Enoyl-CoA hydratase/isomerase n=1 Tax=Allomyces macrogynus (strain ATCC 38327) TaxID=578462 RepID=A0A0L0T4V9_ALLM3|nr:hypothetical protein AMAG_14124 [Allomyces macrogynus ATCC 38327]|eukprot:KNE69564.1 hypothetical protein AMAG_14124 [Allomyces macrogynus ATCC 38327]
MIRSTASSLLARGIARTSVAPAVARAPWARFSSTVTKDEPFLQVTRDTLPDGQFSGVVQVKFNRPKSLNALTHAMGLEFSQTMKDLAKDKTIRAMILSGEGRAFSAGGDLDFLDARAEASPVANTEVMREFYSLFLSVRSVPFPTIAAINGPAIGAGFCLALACDLRLATADAKVGLNFVKLGIPAGMGAQTTVEMLAGPQVAARLLLTGDILTGAEAQQLGLVLATHATPADLADHATALARSMASASPVAVRLTTQSLRLRINEALERGLKREADTQAIAYASKDFKVGMKAIRAKATLVFENVE